MRWVGVLWEEEREEEEEGIRELVKEDDELP